MTPGTVAAVVAQRSEYRTVVMVVELVEPIDVRFEADTSCPASRVTLAYRMCPNLHGVQHWSVRCLVAVGRHGVTFEHHPDRGEHARETWPETLADLADQLHPARPGGWPGTDPYGSYL